MITNEEWINIFEKEFLVNRNIAKKMLQSCIEIKKEDDFNSGNFDLPTKKQLDLISNIEEFVNEKFKGSTKKDAYEYISRNIEKYKLELIEMQ